MSVTAAATCSALSRTSSAGTAPSTSPSWATASSPGPGRRRMPAASITSPSTSAPSFTADRSTNVTPPGKSSPGASVSSVARRVLPTPPSPTTVTSGASATAWRRSASSRRRPTNAPVRPGGGSGEPPTRSASASRSAATSWRPGSRPNSASSRRACRSTRSASARRPAAVSRRAVPTHRDSRSGRATASSRARGTAVASTSSAASSIQRSPRSAISSVQYDTSGAAHASPATSASGSPRARPRAASSWRRAAARSPAAAAARPRVPWSSNRSRSTPTSGPSAYPVAVRAMNAVADQLAQPGHGVAQRGQCGRGDRIGPQALHELLVGGAAGPTGGEDHHQLRRQPAGHGRPLAVTCDRQRAQDAHVDPSHVPEGRASRVSGLLSPVVTVLDTPGGIDIRPRDHCGAGLTGPAPASWSGVRVGGHLHPETAATRSRRASGSASSTTVAARLRTIAMTMAAA